MATIAKRRQRAAVGRKGSRLSAELQFPPGSLESELSAIGQSVQARKWAKVPDDYFANLDSYLHGAPKKK